MQSRLSLSVLVICLSCWSGLLLAAKPTTRPAILVLGDSISAAYGINTHEGWVALLQQRLTQKSLSYRVVNASVSGDTTRTGLNRLEDALKQHRPQIIIIALGGNDGLRGLPFSEIENSLSNIIETAHRRNVKVLLVGVRLPPNYGAAYTQRFTELYQQLGKRYQVAVVPRLLDHVSDDSTLMQADGIHPSAEGQAQILENIWLQLQSLLNNTKIIK